MAANANHVEVQRNVIRWTRFKDCWEADLSCGHKHNTGPGSIDDGGVHVFISSTTVRCSTCESVAEQVLKGFPRG